MTTTMTDQKQKQATVHTLRESIAKLTGRKPVSADPRYLAQRLADLKARKEQGEDIKHTVGDPPSLMTVSMPRTARDALSRILKKEKVSASELVRRSLALWASANGYKPEGETIGGQSS